MNVEKNCAQSVTVASPVMNVNVIPCPWSQQNLVAQFGQEMIMFENRAISVSAYTNNTLIKGLLIELIKTGAP